MTQLVPRQLVFLVRDGVDARLHILPASHSADPCATARQ
jgi:hypothetical protein